MEPEPATIGAEAPLEQRRRRRPRWPFLAAGIAAVMVALGSYIWFVRIPNDRPELEPGERYGIDVSSHQGAIDWASVAGDGIGFVYIKATEGGDFVDDHFAVNWAGAGAAGLERGAYHFFTLCRPGADQAANFLHTVPHDPAALPPVVDLEFVGNCTGRPSRDALLHELNTFVTTVEAATGKHVVLYLVDDFDAYYGIRQALTRPLWERSLFRRPNQNDWLIWQASNQANVAGVTGGVDLNIMKPTA